MLYTPAMYKIRKICRSIHQYKSSMSSKPYTSGWLAQYHRTATRVSIVSPTSRLVDITHYRLRSEENRSTSHRPCRLCFCLDEMGDPDCQSEVAFLPCSMMRSVVQYSRCARAQWLGSRQVQAKNGVAVFRGRLLDLRRGHVLGDGFYGHAILVPIVKTSGILWRRSRPLGRSRVPLAARPLFRRRVRDPVPSQMR